MATHQEHDQQPIINTGPDAQHESVDTDVQPIGEGPSNHGSTGEGSVSAMARLISEEKARRSLPSNADDPRTGSS